MKKSFAVVCMVLCFTAGTAFGGARRQGGSGDTKIQLEFWTLALQPTFTGFIQGMIDTYEAQHPNIRIYWQDLPWDGIQDKFLTATAGGNPPDVVNIWSQLALTYGGKGALLDLEANATPAQKAIYLEAAYNSARLGNSVYAFPWYATPNISVYNKELLAKGGLSKPPETFDEAFAQAVDFRTKTGAYLLTPPSMFHVFYNYGIPMVSEDKRRAAFNTPEAVALVTRLRDLGRAGAFNTEPGSWDDWDGDRQLFATEKLAMVLGGPQTVTRIKDEAPAMLAKTGVGPAVMGPAEISGEAILNVVVSKGTKHPKEAVDFANFITNDENQLAFCHIVSIFPTTKIAAADPFFRSDMETLEGQANYYASISAQDAVDMTLGLENDENVKQEIDNITDAIFATGTDPARAIANAEARVNDLLAQNR
jgi:putative chitobiose transport system substrate-binding protein